MKRAIEACHITHILQALLLKCLSDVRYIIRLNSEDFLS